MNSVHFLRRRPTWIWARAGAAFEIAAAAAVIPGTTAAAATHSPASASSTSRRFVSSFRRTQKALRVPPAPSFTPSPSPSRRNAPFTAADRQQPRRQQQIIFNPPSSAPSVYHTPLKFLPASDPRRELLLAEARRREEPASGVSSSTSGDVAVAGNAAGSGGLRKVAEMRAAEARARPQSHPTSSASSSIPLPPALDRPHEKKYHLTPAQIAEMQRLRTEDPHTWTRRRLAEKFACSEFFVSIASAAPAEFRAARAAELEAVKARWGRTKREAREDRATRKSAWGRDA